MQSAQISIVNRAEAMPQEGECPVSFPPEAGKPECARLARMAGRALAMQHLFARMRYTAPHFRLAAVEGEPGTGKLLVAETLHRIGPAAAGPFAPAIAADFMEDAQTIWSQSRSGLLYLSRVDELTPDQQRQLRDLLERAAHERLRTRALSGPLQLVAGSSQPLRRLAAAGAFRSDLASHLTAIRFVLPPLRERREDIPVLAELFLGRWSRRNGRPMRGFAPGAMPRLVAYSWPGNVLELEMVVASAALECPGEWIRPVDLPSLEGVVPRAGVGSRPTDEEDAGLDPNLDRAIQRHVTRILAQADGNKVRAARLLGISRSTLYRLLDSARAQERPVGQE